MATKSKAARPGTKVSQSEATKDPKKLIKLSKADAGTPDVEGQYPYAARVQCPGCGTWYRTTLDTDEYRYFTCPGCGTYFKA